MRRLTFKFLELFPYSYAAYAQCVGQGGNVTVEKISDLKEMMILGVMVTPAVVIDGLVKCSGRIPSKEEVAGWIDQG